MKRTSHGEEPTPNTERKLQRKGKLRKYLPEPKNVLTLVISVIALVVALTGTAANVFYTRKSQNEQNSRWDTANLSRVSLLKAHFFTWKIIPKDEVDRFEGDNKSLSFYEVVNDARTGALKLATQVVPYDIGEQKYLLKFGDDTLSKVQEKIRSYEREHKAVVGKQGLSYRTRYIVIFQI